MRSHFNAAQQGFIPGKAFRRMAAMAGGFDGPGFGPGGHGGPGFGPGRDFGPGPAGPDFGPGRGFGGGRAGLRSRSRLRPAGGGPGAATSAAPSSACWPRARPTATA